MLQNKILTKMKNMKNTDLVGRSLGRVTSSENIIGKLIDQGYEKIGQKGISQTFIKRKDNKINTYVLMLSKEFLKGHSHEGLPTQFVELLSTNTKIHTIRMNYEFWKNRVKEINAGKAILSIRVWKDKPYNSKQFEIKKLTKLGIQKLIRDNDGYFTIEGAQASIYNIAMNDGLTLDNFMEWLFPEFTNRNKDLAIIHFTDFRY